MVAYELLNFSSALLLFDLNQNSTV